MYVQFRPLIWKQFPKMFCKKAVLNNFVKVAEKHLPGLQSKALLKTDSDTVVLLWILQNSSKDIFYKTRFANCFFCIILWLYKNHLFTKKQLHLIKVYWSQPVINSLSMWELNLSCRMYYNDRTQTCDIWSNVYWAAQIYWSTTCPQRLEEKFDTENKLVERCYEFLVF